MNNKEATELVRRLPETFATIQEYIEKLERENETLRKSMTSITPFLAELVNVFDCAQTNGDLFDLADVCIKYRDAIDTARKEQHERKIKQMTDAASLDIGHSCLSGDKWMRDASYYGN